MAKVIEDLAKAEGDAACPKVFFEANSVDAWDRHRIEGYGLLEIDLERVQKAGGQEMTVPMWRPLGTIREEAARFFIGGGKRLKDAKDIAVPQGAENSLNSRREWQTIQGGNLHIRLNVVSTRNQTELQAQSKQPVKKAKSRGLRKRKTKLSKLISLAPASEEEPAAKAKRHKRKKTSKLLQKVHLGD